MKFNDKLYYYRVFLLDVSLSSNEVFSISKPVPKTNNKSSIKH